MPNSRVYFQVWIHCHDPICENMSSQTKEFHDSSMQESRHAFWIRIQTAGFGPTPVDFAVQTAPGAIPIIHIQTIVSFHSSFSFLYIFFFLLLLLGFRCLVPNWERDSHMPALLLYASSTWLCWSLFGNKPPQQHLLLLFPLLFSRPSIHLPIHPYFHLSLVHPSYSWAIFISWLLLLLVRGSPSTSRDEFAKSTNGPLRLRNSSQKSMTPGILNDMSWPWDSILMGIKNPSCSKSATSELSLSSISSEDGHGTNNQCL